MGKSSTPSVPKSPYETAMAQIAKEYYAQTSPLRTEMIGQLQNFVSPGPGQYDPYKLPAYEPIYNLARSGLESQYGQARQDIMAQTPRGGALTESLGNLAMSRAKEAGGLPAQISAQIIPQLFGQALGMATGAAGQALQGLGGAASSYASRYGAQAQLAAQQQAQDMSLYGGLGSLLGAQYAALMFK